MFQSSPNPQTGCDVWRWADPRRPARFNPHPILRLGATPSPPADPTPSPCFNPHPILRLGATASEGVDNGGLVGVSILTQSSDWVRQVGRVVTSARMIVSILTQSSDWVRRNEASRDAAAAEFQSSPNPQTGCDPSGKSASSRHTAVSILTQSSDWVRLAVGMLPEPRLWQFQSSPNPQTGCDAVGGYPEPMRLASIVSILTQSSDWVRHDDMRRTYAPE